MMVLLCIGAIYEAISENGDNSKLSSSSKIYVSKELAPSTGNSTLTNLSSKLEDPKSRYLPVIWLHLSLQFLVWTGVLSALQTDNGNKLAQSVPTKICAGT